MPGFLSPKQVARAAEISESTVKRWCDRGVLPFVRTPGGHRRISLNDALQTLKTKNIPIVHPEVLGLPAFPGRGRRTITTAVEELVQALENASPQRCRAILGELRCVGLSFAEIGDQVISPAFERIGKDWECGRLEVYRERAACYLLFEVLSEMAEALPPEDPTQPLAIGATLSHDHYFLASQLVQLVFRERKWRARFLGSHLPLETLVRAIVELQPRLFWLSISHVVSSSSVIEACRSIYDVARAQDTLFVIGGRGIDDALRRQLSYSAYCQDLSHLTMLLDTLPISISQETSLPVDKRAT